MGYISCEESQCDYPEWCQSDHWRPDPIPNWVISMVAEVVDVTTWSPGRMIAYLRFEDGSASKVHVSLKFGGVE